MLKAGDKMKFNKYKHKKTGMIVTAIRYSVNKGLEDGYKCDFDGISKPYKLLATFEGNYKECFLNENIYLVRRKGYLFALEKYIFFALYSRCKAKR